ncbi:hypothetical protein V8F33_005980 [Rhypophila sp. PSN 637]
MKRGIKQTSHPIIISPTSVNAAFSDTAKHFSQNNFHLDVVINNAGYSLSGNTDSYIKKEAIFFHISLLTKLYAFPRYSYYYTSKFAIEGWSKSIAREVHLDQNNKADPVFNFYIVELSGPYPTYTAANIPVLKLEIFVYKGVEMGIGMMEPSTITDARYSITRRRNRRMAKVKCKGFLGGLDAVKGVSGMGHEF